MKKLHFKRILAATMAALLFMSSFAVLPVIAKNATSVSGTQVISSLTVLSIPPITRIRS